MEEKDNKNENHEESFQENLKKQNEEIIRLKSSAGHQDWVNDSIKEDLRNLETRRAQFEENMTARFDSQKRADTRGKVIQSFLIAILLGILSFFLYQTQDRFISIEHRLTVLETKLKDDIKSPQTSIRSYGGFDWQTFTGYDLDEDDNVKLGVQVDILTEQYRWECGSIQRIVRGGEEIDFDRVIQAYLTEKHLNGVKELICIGAASSEGKRGDEEVRAKDRMETLFNVVNLNLDVPNIRIRGLNIGQFVEDNDKSCSDETLSQRRVIILKVIEKREGLSRKDYLDGVIKILLSQARSEIEFPIDIRDYSKFQDGNLKFHFGRGNGVED